MTADATIPSSDPSTPARTGIATQFFGGALICGALVLLLYFLSDPTASLPFFPLAWIGGPLLTLIVFMAICGVYFFVQRRFSLGGFLVALLTALLVSSSATIYMQSLSGRIQRPVETMGFKIDSPEVAETLDLTSQERLETLLNTAYADGLIERIDFNHVGTAASDLGNRTRIDVVFDQTHIASIRRKSNGARNLVTEYCRMLIASHRFSQMNPGVEFTPNAADAALLVENLVPSEVFSRGSRHAFDDARRRLEWIASRETDEDLLKFIRAYINVLTPQNLPGITVPPPPSGRKNKLKSL